VSKPEKPKCPKCGGTSLQVWEDTLCTRDVHDFNEYGQLMVDGYASAGESEGDRFYCRSCGHEFPIPEDIEIEYT